MSGPRLMPDPLLASALLRLATAVQVAFPEPQHILPTNEAYIAEGVRFPKAIGEQRAWWRERSRALTEALSFAAIAAHGIELGEWDADRLEREVSSFIVNLEDRALNVEFALISSR